MQGKLTLKQWADLVCVACDYSSPNDYHDYLDELKNNTWVFDLNMYRELVPFLVRASRRDENQPKSRHISFSEFIFFWRYQKKFAVPSYREFIFYSYEFFGWMSRDTQRARVTELLKDRRRPKIETNEETQERAKRGLLRFNEAYADALQSDTSFLYLDGCRHYVETLIDIKEMTAFVVVANLERQIDSLFRYTHSKEIEKLFLYQNLQTGRLGSIHEMRKSLKRDDRKLETQFIETSTN